MKKTLMISLALLCASAAFAGHASKIPVGSKIFVQSNSDFATYVSVEVLKEKMPVVITTNQADADYILKADVDLTGTSTRGNGSLLHPERSQTENSAAVTLISTKDQTIVWGGDTGKGNLSQAARRDASLVL